MKPYFGVPLFVIITGAMQVFPDAMHRLGVGLGRSLRAMTAGAGAGVKGMALWHCNGGRGLHAAAAGGAFAGWGLAGRMGVGAAAAVVDMGMTGLGARAMSVANSKKETTWYGARRSMDPTAPTVIRRRPTTPSQRHTAIIDKSRLWRGAPEKCLSVGLRNTGGRNNQGRITVRGRGGGNKRVYRIVDFKRCTREGTIVTGTIERIEYDPNRSAFICLLKHPVDLAEHGAHLMKPRRASLSYIICPRSVTVGQEVRASKTEPLDIQIGNSMQLRHIPVGTKVHCIECNPGKGATFSRSAGTSAQVIELNSVKGTALLRMQSKEMRYVQINCMATIGEVSNPEHKNEVWGKAGRSRWYGFRPQVRGVAMNPVDHPHGGGEGKKHHGRHPVSPWGLMTKGFKTVRKLSPMIKTPRWKVKAQKA